MTIYPKFKRFNMKMKETARIIENVCSEYKNELELIEYYKCVLTLLYDKYIRSPQNIEKTDNQGHIEETKNISDPKLSKGTKAIDNNLTLNDNNITQDKIVIKKTKRKDSYQKKIKKFKIQK